MSDLPRFLTTEKLNAIVVAHLGRDIPPKTGRDKLLAAAMQLGLITDEQRDAEPPTYKKTDELEKLCKDAGVVFARGKTPKNRDDWLKACKDNNLIDDEQAGAARKRKDISDKRKSVAGREEFTRTTTLSCLLYGQPNKEAIIQRVQSAANLMSQIMVQRSFLVWFHLYRIIDQNLPFPDLADDNATFFRHCFAINTVSDVVKNGEIKTHKCATKDVDIQETIDAYPGLFSKLKQPSLMGNCVSQAAKLYRTNFTNHFALLDNVLARVRKIASYELFGIERRKLGEAELAELGKEPLHSVMCAVETGVMPEHERQMQLALSIRTRLGLPAGVELDKSWLHANLEKSVRFTLRMAKDFDALRVLAAEMHRDGTKVRKGVTKGVKWIPTHKVQAASIKLDASDIARALIGRDLKDAELAETVVREFFRPGIARAFGAKYASGDPDGLEFTSTIDTNGTQVSVHFKRPRRHKPKKKSAAEKVAEAKKPVSLPRVVMVVDPGRVRIVTMSIFLDNEPYAFKKYKKDKTVRNVPLRFKFTGAQYYSTSGIRVATRCQRMRRQKVVALKKLDTVLSKNTTRTGDSATMASYLRAMTSTWDAAFAFAGSKKSRGVKLRLFAGKQRAQARFFDRVHRALVAHFGREEADKALMVWGCAKVSPSGKGNLTVPTQGIAAVAARYWRIMSGDEYRTSSACSKAGCHHDLHEVRVALESVKVVVRTVAGRKFAWQVRHGFVRGRHHKRLLKRHLSGKGYAEARLARVKIRKKWVINGHGGETAEEKAEKAAARRAAGMLDSRYIRGLRFCQGCEKLEDRDNLACDNIGTIFVCKCNRVAVPHAFDRAIQKARRSASLA